MVTSPPVPPSGEQHELRHGEHELTVVEVGGGLRTYRLGGVDVLDGYPVEHMCDGARGQTLVPWPNRLEDGAYEFDGEQHQLPLTEPDRHNAIHGLARWGSWQLAERGDGFLALSHRLMPQAGYPFAVTVRNEYRLDDDGLSVTTVATNVGHRPAPYGVGFHPYLTVGTERIDDAELHIAASSYLPTNDRGLPRDTAPVTGTDYDFREPRRIGEVQIDTTYADLERDAGGRATATLSSPDHRRVVTVWLGEGFDYLEVFTGDTLPDPQRRRRGLGVEPMSCPPNAFRTGQVDTVAPGDSVTTRWGIRVEGR